VFFATNISPSHPFHHGSRQYIRPQVSVPAISFFSQSEATSSGHPNIVQNRHRAMLVDLLESLPVEKWARQTVARLWNVKDVAAHLLDGNIRILSMLRDGYAGEKSNSDSAYRNTESKGILN
jgi:Mycothiol maleylpyruvate isomerase N-terminal domain